VNSHVDIILHGRQPYAHPGHDLGSGNRCGHDPQQPRFLKIKPPPTKKQRPWQQEALIKSAENLYYDRDLIPGLGYHLDRPLTLSGMPPKSRSDGLDNIVIVCKTMLGLMDYSSYMIGRPHAYKKDVWSYYSNYELYKFVQAELAENDYPFPLTADKITPSFVDRAIAALKEQGMLKTKTIYRIVEVRNADGSVTLSKRASTAVKRLEPWALLRLGALTKQELEDFSSECYERLKKKKARNRKAHEATRQAKIEKTQQEALKMRAGADVSPVTEQPPVRVKTDPARNYEQDLQERYNRDRNAAWSQAFDDGLFDFTSLQQAWPKSWHDNDIWCKQNE